MSFNTESTKSAFVQPKLCDIWIKCHITSLATALDIKNMHEPLKSTGRACRNALPSNMRAHIMSCSKLMNKSLSTPVWPPLIVTLPVDPI